MTIDTWAVYYWGDYDTMDDDWCVKGSLTKCADFIAKCDDPGAYYIAPYTD